MDGLQLKSCESIILLNSNTFLASFILEFILYPGNDGYWRKLLPILFFTKVGTSQNTSSQRNGQKKKKNKGDDEVMVSHLKQDFLYNPRISTPASHPQYNIDTYNSPGI